MKKRLIILGLTLLVLGVNSRALAQFTPEELAEMPKWEEFLAAAEIVGQEQLSGPGAVTNPWELTLKQGDITRNALWKNISGRPKGYIDSWKYEIAAYRMDKLIGLNMVPPTIEKRFHEDRGSCQLWIDAWMNLKKIKEQKIKTPSIKIFYWNRALYLQRAFDNLIGNEDRHQANYLLMPDWRLILIDHSRSFRTSKKFTKELIYSEKHPEGPMLMSELPRALVEKIKALTFESIKNAVGEYLTDEEINAVLTRKDLILQEIDRLIKKNGEENVLY
jgi:hypothetical protein